MWRPGPLTKSSLFTAFSDVFGPSFQAGPLAGPGAGPGAEQELDPPERPTVDPVALEVPLADPIVREAPETGSFETPAPAKSDVPETRRAATPEASPPTAPAVAAEKAPVAEAPRAEVPLAETQPLPMVETSPEPEGSGARDDAGLSRAVGPQLQASYWSADYAFAEPDYSDEGPQTGALVQESLTGRTKVDGGRVSTIALADSDEIVSLRIVEQPHQGHVSANPDNTLALVLSDSDYQGGISLGYEATYADGRVITEKLDLQVQEPRQDAGWGQAEHYMLAEDASGDLVVETGAFHRKVFATAGDHGLTRADIAEREGLKVSEIDGKWLAEHPDYGGSEGMALSEDAAMALWERLTWENKDTPHSNWLLLERGYTYDTIEISLRDHGGESALHPVHFTAWGAGERPILTTEVTGFRDVGSHQVLSDLSLHGGVRLLDGDGVIFHNVEVTDETVNIQNMSRVTFHDSMIHNVTQDRPNGADWHAFDDRESGLFVHNSSGLLLEGNYFHHNAWADDYAEKNGGQPPSMFSHNIYINYNVEDVTVTDNIISQGASYGAMFRGGVWAAENAFIDNNAGVTFLGGDYRGAGPVGNYTYFADNVITSAGHKEADQIGALAWGIYDGGQQTTLLDNVVAHLANPNNAQEIARKDGAFLAVQSDHAAAYDDTIVYNWHPAEVAQESGTFDRNVEGLDQARLDMVTIQRFAAETLGDMNASIDDLLDYILALPEEAFDTVSAEDIVAFFQNGFALSSSSAGIETHRFVPNDLGEGQRWHSPINWHSDTVPEDGDNVMLGGNAVIFGGQSAVTALDFGASGSLDVQYGKLTVRDSLLSGEAGALSVSGSGQFWTEGLTEGSRLAIDVEGGRFANTGYVDGDTVLHATGGDTLLGVDRAVYTLSAESSLRLDGSDLRVGFDGMKNGVSVLALEEESTLSFIADAAGLATIEEFRSGAFDDGARVRSGVSLDGTLQLDLTQLGGTPGVHTLIDVDAMRGLFEDIEIYGLSRKMDALVRFDYALDTVSLHLSRGTGSLGVDVIGDPQDGLGESLALWSDLSERDANLDDPTMMRFSGSLPDSDPGWI